MSYQNLVPGQWQIGDIVMGRGTNIIIEEVNINPDDINAQDYQVARTDENRFGIDLFKPTTIEFTMSVLNNVLLPDWEGYIPNFWDGMPTVQDLAKEWRFDEGRKIWGQMKHMYVCSRRDEIPKVIFGRPGQFKYDYNATYGMGEVIQAIGEYRKADTIAYSAAESTVIVPGGGVSIVAGGDVDTWFRMTAYGPMTNPTFTINGVTMSLSATIGSGKFAEISSYPWSRRIVNSDGVNLSANLTGDGRFLDKGIVPAGQSTSVSWTGGGSLHFSWRNAYSVI